MKYLYKKIVDYLSVYIRPGDSLVEVDGVEALDGLCLERSHENLSIGGAEEIGDRVPATIELSS